MPTSAVIATGPLPGRPVDVLGRGRADAAPGQTAWIRIARPGVPGDRRQPRPRVRRGPGARTGPTCCSAPPRGHGDRGRPSRGRAGTAGPSRTTPIPPPPAAIAAARDRFGRLDGALISVGGTPAGTIAATPTRRGGPRSRPVPRAVRLARVLATELDGRSQDGALTGTGGSHGLGLRGRVYLVTGGIRGLGFAAAQALDRRRGPRAAQRSPRGHGDRVRGPAHASPRRGGHRRRRARGVRARRRVPALPGRVLHHRRDDPG